MNHSFQKGVTRSTVVGLIFLGLAIVGIGYLAGCTALDKPADQPVKVVHRANPSIPGFQFKSVAIGSQQLNYYEGGAGEPVVLLHGWPQSAYAWRTVAPLLAKKYHVIIPNLPGIAGSDAISGPTKSNMAQDIHTLAAKLGISSARLVGHDIGGMVAHAYAINYPNEVSHVAIIEIPIPGLKPWDLVVKDPRVWHFAFHNVPEIPEMLVEGREDKYFTYFYNTVAGTKDVVTPEEIRVYAAAYATPTSLKASFDWYRALKEDETNFTRSSTKITAKVLLAGGDQTVGALLPLLKEGYAKHQIEDLETYVFSKTGHWVLDETPEELSEVLLKFLRK